MSTRLAWVTTLILILLVATLPTSPAQAQTAFPSWLAEEMAVRLSNDLADALYAPAWVEPAPHTGWRVVMPLRGQPAAQRQGVQSPPPATNTLAWIDLYRYGTPRNVPNDIDNMSSYVMVTASGETYAIYHGGFFWLRLRNASQRCFESIIDSRMWPI